MRNMLWIASCLALALAARAEAGVVCVSDSADGSAGQLTARDACLPHETELGSFEALRMLLAALSREDDGATLRLTGLNLQIVSGTGDTYASRNGRGNLILGYNASPEFGTPAKRNGSHNLVIGDQHAYYGSGNLLAGFSNQVVSDKGSVLGGSFNTANELGAVAGGFGNATSAQNATVCGGRANHAGGLFASVSGGLLNQATGNYASIAGGLENFATAPNASVAGGSCNVAGSDDGLDLTACVAVRAISPVVSGGTNNVASGEWSVVGGGKGIVVRNDLEWHAGQTAGFPDERVY